MNLSNISTPTFRQLLALVFLLLHEKTIRITICPAFGNGRFRGQPAAGSSLPVVVGAAAGSNSSGNRRHVLYRRLAEPLGEAGRGERSRGENLPRPALCPWRCAGLPARCRAARRAVTRPGVTANPRSRSLFGRAGDGRVWAGVTTSAPRGGDPGGSRPSRNGRCPLGRTAHGRDGWVARPLSVPGAGPAPGGVRWQRIPLASDAPHLSDHCAGTNKILCRVCLKTAKYGLQPPKI